MNDSDVTFDDLIRGTGTVPEEAHETHPANKALGVFVFMPFLVWLGIVTVCACVLYFIYRYLDELTYALLFFVQIFFSGGF